MLLTDLIPFVIYTAVYYLVFILMVSGISLLCTGMVLNVHMKSPVTKMSWCTRTLIFDIIGRLVCHSCSPNRKEDTEKKRTFSTGFDDFIYKQYGNISDNIQNNEVFTIPNQDVIMTSQNGRIAGTKQHQGVSMASKNDHVDQTVMCDHNSLNYAILREIKKITAKMESDAEEEKLKFAWNEAAKILDRFCLLIFIMLKVGAIVMLFEAVYEWW